jgi:hypothetical protein
VHRQRPEQPPIHSWFCLLVASPRVPDLLLCAKHLFFAAIAAWLRTATARRGKKKRNCRKPDVCLCIIREQGPKPGKPETVSVSTALACAAIPLSFHWSPGKTPSVSVDQADARVGRPLTATSVAGVSRRVHRRAYRRAATGAAVGVATTGAYVGASAPAPYTRAYVGASAPAPYYGPVAAGYGPGPGGAIVVNPVTGRSCTTEPSGFQWCWTPERR